MSRLSVFRSADNERGYVQAVIHQDDKPVFISLGFVCSVDDLQEQEQEQERRGRGRPPKSSGNSEE